jgi:ATP-dependent RNA helicase DDX49/DBP8
VFFRASTFFIDSKDLRRGAEIITPPTEEVIGPFIMPSTVSSSDNEVESAYESSGDVSGPEDELIEDNPRKRRRISLSDDLQKERVPDQILSRIKLKKTGLLPDNSYLAKDSVNAHIQKRERTTFADLNVQPWLVASLSSMAITRPTGIQKGCIPEILSGRDCIGGSRTGSGKTVAFAVPILQKWAEDPFGIFAVVLTPTRCVSTGSCE